MYAFLLTKHCVKIKTNIVGKKQHSKFVKDEEILNVDGKHFNHLAGSCYHRKLYKYLIAFNTQWESRLRLANSNFQVFKRLWKLRGCCCFADSKRQRAAFCQKTKANEQNKGLSNFQEQLKTRSLDRMTLWTTTTSLPKCRNRRN